MSAPTPLDNDGTLLLQLAQQTRALFVKKLSVNDRDWAWPKALRGNEKHQYGPYIPSTERDGGFFPPLKSSQRSDGRTAEIREAEFETVWPQFGERRQSRLVHYTSKGTETHLTRVPKVAFADLAPASYLVIGKVGRGASAEYQCLTIDSTSDAAEWLTDTFRLPPDFLGAMFDPEEYRGRDDSELAQFVSETLKAFFAGQITQYAASHAKLPTTGEIANRGRERYMRRVGLDSLDPFRIERPGDVLRQISRGDEYELFKELQLRARALELVVTVVGTKPRLASLETAISNIILNYRQIDAILLSASQQRRTRAGYSFEHHIDQMLRDGSIPFKSQVVIGARKRPDFVLPSERVLKDVVRRSKEALILSAKTTLRERWKQVQREKQLAQVPLFLATVDENVPGNAIEDMKSLDIWLVVPESLKRPTEKRRRISEYGGHTNVIDFRTFFDVEVVAKRSTGWGVRLAPFALVRPRSASSKRQRPGVLPFGKG